MMVPAAAVLQLLLLLIATVTTTQAELSNIPIKTHKYEYDGSGNNPNNPAWGKAGSPRVRVMPSEDGFKERPGLPRSEFTDDLPSARKIMEELFRFPALKKKKASTSTNDLKLLFGMVISSDILGAAGKNASEPFDMTGDGNFTDGVFCPVTGKFEATEGYAKSFPRYNHQLVETPEGEPVRATSNKGTAWMDLGCIYGTTEQQNVDIRTFEGGNFDLVDKNGNGLLPRQPYLRGCFSIVPGAYSLHVLWMRLHNHVAKIISKENPDFNDEEIFQAARNYVIATYQKNAVTKYIPALLGDSMGPYQGYDPSLDPSIDEYFGAVTYRYGHSEQPDIVRLVDEDFLPTSQDPIFMRSAYHGNPQQIIERAGGIEDVLRGATTVPTKPFDYYFEDDLNFYAKATSMVDVQRARDVGIPPYNQARRNMGLEPISTIRELVVNEGGYDNDELVRVVENLYGNDIEKVDSYVATLFEKPIIPDGLFGPSLTDSTRDQIHRVRSGDRFWYENTFSEEEIMALPSLTEVIKLVCKGMDKFPETFFRVYGYENNGSGAGAGAGAGAGGEDGNCDGEFKNQLGLLGGDMTMKWIIDQPLSNPRNANKKTTDEAMESTIELTLTANAEMEGAGFLGVGWRSRKMAGAEIWFCTVNPGLFGQGITPNCDDRQTTPDMFQCCVASGANVKPSCLSPEDSRHYELDVINWCLSPEESSVTVKALVCDEHVETDCFDISSNPDGSIDMIVSYNPNDQNRPHGFQRRTSTVVDLKAGIMTASEDGVADTGLIAYHGITMLVFWMIMAPIGIYIVRYMKTKSWRLAAHISIMGVVGGLTIPIIVGVESAVGASSDKTQEHSMIGIALTLLFLPMFFAGRIRYSKLQGQQVGRKTAHYALIFHKCFGYGILIFSWWNCYTGLVRISPADAYFQLIVLSSYSIGYDVPIFGYIKDSIYWPYLAMVCIIYALAEVRKRVLNRMMQNQTAKTIWDSETDDPQEYDEMGMDKFLELVKLGSPLCIIDGRVLDLTGFLEHHPGGSDMLENIAGTEITDEVKGLRAIEGFRHKHSYIAVQKMRTLIVGILVDEADDKVPPLPKFLQAAQNMKRTSARRKISSDLETSSDSDTSSFHFGRTKALSQVFRRARIVQTTFVTPSNEITQENKPVVMLYLAAPKRRDLESKDGIIVPSSAYKFRVTNPWGTTFEAYYTPVNPEDGPVLENNSFDLKDEEELLKFFYQPSSRWPNHKSLHVLESRKDYTNPWSQYQPCSASFD
mmetsp:Transcript_5710/g.13451  ORF Transcript_5710/g.13451 Transcript_5710/m.13451 type:complete len:1254 (+) Transcript_5710:47-3808(+)